MDKQLSVTQGEWPIMELLWQGPKTLMELVSALAKQVGWSKSTVTTMVRRMDDKGLITFHVEGRTKVIRAVFSREEVTAQETTSLLERAYSGSIGLMISAMAHRNDLTRDDIDELYAILKEAEEGIR